ncbi:sugar ABC transporter substrate-binding protein [Xanthobacter sp. KR7-225]|uniref:sugar ABC transporter substrate-binding protein n=1 Tax=Xanthobacter sp. KR7-225 TaxID=3156613 RepID=UPI0032B409A8
MRPTRTWTAAVCLLALGVAGIASAKDTAQLIGLSKPNLKGPYPTAELYGILDEAKKEGFTVIVQDAGGYSNIDRQLDQISNLVVKGVKAILIDPNDPAAMTGVAMQARAAGVFLVGAGVNVIARGVEPDAAVSSSHCNIGRELAAGAKKLLPSGGKIGILAGPAGSFWATERLRCFKDDIAGSGLRIVAEIASEQDAATSLTRANEILQRNPDLDLIYGADDVYGVGAARAARSSGRCGKIKVIFAVLGDEAEEMMRAGCADFVVAQQSVLIGRTEVRTVRDLIKGIKPDPKVINVPLVDVTPANLDSVDKSTLQPPKGWRP